MKETDVIIGDINIVSEFHWSCSICGWKTWQYTVRILREKALNHSKKHLKTPLKEVKSK